MNKDATTKKPAKSARRIRLAAFDAMTDEEVHAAAPGDPDAQPHTEE
jgi:hypothetical protein